MNRRDFTTLSAGAACGAFGAAVAGLGALALPTGARAQGAPVEGQQYMKVQQRQQTLDPKKIEVIEFFWYGCPHCFAFEPELDTWQKKLPADVVFRRLPVAWREVPFVTHQKLYFAIEGMGLVEPLHRKVFNAIHVDRNPLDKPEAISEFVAKNGADTAKFMALFNSFGVAAKAKQAAALAQGYRIDGTPAMGVNGNYFTSGTLAGSNERALAVTDYLLAQSRKGA